MISEKNYTKKNLRGHFGELSAELSNRIRSMYRYRINSVMFNERTFFSYI